MFRSALPFLLLAMLATACKPTHKVKSTSDLKPLKINCNKADEVLGTANRFAPDWTWLGGKAKVSFSGMGQSMTVDANVRLRKDSVLWMSLGKFGIEGARIMVTPDSFFMLNRQDRSLLAEPFSCLQNMLGYPLTFRDFQQLLVTGNLASWKGFKTNAGTEPDGRCNVVGMDGQNAIKLILNLTGLPAQLTASRNGGQLSMSTENHQVDDMGNIFAYERKMNISSEKTGNITADINITTAQFNQPQRFPFDFSASYERVRLCQ